VNRACSKHQPYPDLPWDEGDLSQLEAFANRLPPWLPPTLNRGARTHRRPASGTTAPAISQYLLPPYQECRAAKTLERRYLTGRVGQLKVLVVATDQVSKGERVWQAFVTEGRYAAPAEAVGFVGEVAREAAE